MRREKHMQRNPTNRNKQRGQVSPYLSSQRTHLIIIGLSNRKYTEGNPITGADRNCRKAVWLFTEQNQCISPEAMPASVRLMWLRLNKQWVSSKPSRWCSERNIQPHTSHMAAKAMHTVPQRSPVSEGAERMMRVIPLRSCKRHLQTSTTAPSHYTRGFQFPEQIGPTGVTQAFSPHSWTGFSGLRPVSSTLCLLFCRGDCYTDHFTLKRIRMLIPQQAKWPLSWNLMQLEKYTS